MGADWTAVRAAYASSTESSRDVQRILLALEIIPELAEALREIAEGRGRFSRDPLEHCSNTVADMKARAQAALARLNEAQP